MFFQQWTGVNAILYYAPTIFQRLGLTGSSVSLLATGVVGIVYAFSQVIISIPSLTYSNNTQHVLGDNTGRYLGR